MKQFLNSTAVVVNNGYLSVEGKEMKPIFHEAFIAAQKRAEYVITFAELAKGKDFEGTKADSLDELKSLVNAKLAEKATEFVKSPKKVKREITEKLAEEAKAFMKFTDDSSKVEKVNAFLQEFNIVHEFEEVGLFFEQDIVKIGKIYTMKEIIKAVNDTVDLIS